jgi:hypothetical protein
MTIVGGDTTTSHYFLSFLMTNTCLTPPPVRLMSEKACVLQRPTDINGVNWSSFVWTAVRLQQDWKS